jgi:hypothetical protein
MLIPIIFGMLLIAAIILYRLKRPNPQLNTSSKPRVWNNLTFEIFDRIIFFDKEWKKQNYDLIGKQINLDIVEEPTENRGAYSLSIDAVKQNENKLILDTNSSFELKEGTIQAHLSLEAHPYGTDPGSYAIISSSDIGSNITGGTGIYERLRGNVSVRGIITETPNNKVTIKCEVNIKPEED